MKKTYRREEAERTLPLLRSIGREASDRMREMRRIAGRIAVLFPRRRVHGEEIRRLESELSVQRRELRHARRELERLGCRLDDGAEARILIPADRGAHVVEGFLSQTRFAPAPTPS